MEQTTWNVNLSTSTGLVIGSRGDIESDASTIIPLTMDAGDSEVLSLQLTDTTAIDTLCIVSDVYGGDIEVASDGNTFTLAGPLILFGELVNHFSSDLSSLTVTNNHTETVNVKILISRDLN